MTTPVAAILDSGAQTPIDRRVDNLERVVVSVSSDLETRIAELKALIEALEDAPAPAPKIVIVEVPEQEQVAVSTEDEQFDVQPGPLAAFRKIPKKIRWWIYSAGATVFAVEGLLDVADAGLIPDRPQAIAWSIAGLFGLTMASANTEKA